ncbi:uncharacterized protein LOC115018771 [Cottoperca gobio]|uniref:Uncharacterized protein LOC115018771 n=1 Tax=Cottoperca gobio TaxID=56716 RepID=A0A6J2R333_COTGO|nr:uncharacterized protein LOC115018771 [Cottoperca gobio]XP_029303852.1 uncharacterized protein LOC115018771 [Cottoperca gobio]XP_029303859.1 uncharacterized protein LOC115018771 [Cottoperca gobio]XP_029303866.1 uncharacterized protein LOC115018771 [Cottoperca gobio]
MEAVCEQVHEGDGEEHAGEDEAMLWSFQEALERQTLQIGASACGATAVVDVLKALSIDVAPEEADRCVQTRLRRNESPLPDYLLSRSEAGATHAQLIQGAQEASKGKVIGRFFHLHPRRRVQLVPWLARWIRNGAVPVATMNMQQAVPEGEEVPDAWHHQLIFGVAPNAVFMTNPLDVESEGLVHQRLCSESVLLIRRDDVLQRLTADCCLSGLSDIQSDPRWRALDIQGQVKQMSREEEQDQPKLTHIRIPAAYSSGITLFALRESELGQELINAAELALL